MFRPFLRAAFMRPVMRQCTEAAPDNRDKSSGFCSVREHRPTSTIEGALRAAARAASPRFPGLDAPDARRPLPSRRPWRLQRAWRPSWGRRAKRGYPPPTARSAQASPATVLGAAPSALDALTSRALRARTSASRKVGGG